MNGQEGAMIKKKAPTAKPYVMVDTSHLLPCLSAKYPPGNCTSAMAIDPAKPIRESMNSSAPKLK